MRRRRMLLVALGCLLGGVGGIWAANVWIRRSTAPFVHESADGLPAREVAIVPGARVHEDGRPYPVLEDRLEAARVLYRRGSVRRILVSGAGDPGGFDEPAGMRRWLVQRGVPPEDIIVDTEGFRTFETMARARNVYGVREAVVCTQRFHLARSVFLARESGIDAVGLVADRRVYRSRRKDAARETLARARALLDVTVRPRAAGRP